MATTQTEKKSSGRKNGVYGFIVSALDGDVMRSYIKKNKLEIDVEQDDEKVAVALHSHFHEQAKGDEDKLLKCDTCLGIASKDTDACPFCGDPGTIDDEEDAEPVAAAAESTPEVTGDEESDDDNADEDEEEDDEDEGDEEEESEEEGDSDDEGDEEEDTPPPAKKVAAKAAKTQKTETNMTTAATTNGVSKKSAAMTKTGSSASLAAKDLDKAVSEVKQLAGSAAESYWELGKKLLEINKKGLWKLRVDENGKAKYKGWDAFVHAELKISVQHSYNAMEIASKYKDAKLVHELGQTKALLLLKAAEKDRPALTAKAKAGASKREIAKDVKESRAKHGSPKKGKKAEAGAKGAAAKAKKSVAEKVSIANIEGSKTIKLFKRPESLRGLDWTTLARAKRIADVPFGKLELTNGVAQYFSVLEKDGELVLKVETRRQTAEE